MIKVQPLKVTYEITEKITKMTKERILKMKRGSTTINRAPLRIINIIRVITMVKIMTMTMAMVKMTAMTVMTAV